MNTKEMKKDMTKRLGGKMFVAPSTLVQISGFGNAFVAELLADLDYIPVGRVKKYYVGDVTRKLDELKTR